MRHTTCVKLTSSLSILPLFVFSRELVRNPTFDLDFGGSGEDEGESPGLRLLDGSYYDYEAGSYRKFLDFEDWSSKSFVLSLTDLRWSR